MEPPIALRYFRRGVVRLSNTKESVEKGAEDGEGDENEAEGLFGAVGGLSVVMVSAANENTRTNHAHLTITTSFPVELMNRGLKRV